MTGRILRALPPAMLLAGVLLFVVALLALGVEAAEEEPRPLSPSSLTTVNGTAVLAYPIAHYGSGSSRVEVTYAFPLAPGDVYVLDCDDHAAWEPGGPPDDALLSFTRQREGSFVVSSLTLPPPDVPGLSPDGRSPSRGCRTLVFAWEASEEDSASNRPSATVVARYTPFDQGRYWVLLVIMPAGLLLALAGGLGWARVHRRTRSLPGAEEGPLEMLRVSLDRMGEQMESARRHLFYAGVLGVLVWYPVLVPWTWAQAARASVHPLFPWAVAGLTLAFLAVLTGLWARELHRLDRELAAWRARMGQLREREESLMDTLEGR